MSGDAVCVVGYLASVEWAWVAVIICGSYLDVVLVRSMLCSVAICIPGCRRSADVRGLFCFVLVSADASSDWSVDCGACAAFINFVNFIILVILLNLILTLIFDAMTDVMDFYSIRYCLLCRC